MDRFLLPLLPIFLLATVLESRKIRHGQGEQSLRSSWANPILAVCAGYWLVTDDDFSLEGERARITAREIEIASVLPMVFQSSDGFARLYDSSCLVSSTREDCTSAQAVLFPGTP